MRKKKTIGQLLAEERWKKTTPEQRKEHGRKLTDARLAKRPKLATILDAIEEVNQAQHPDD